MLPAELAARFVQGERIPVTVRYGFDAGAALPNDVFPRLTKSNVELAHMA